MYLSEEKNENSASVSNRDGRRERNGVETKEGIAETTPSFFMSLTGAAIFYAA